MIFAFLVDKKVAKIHGIASKEHLFKVEDVMEVQGVGFSYRVGEERA